MQTFLLFNWFVSTHTHLTLRRVKCRSTYSVSISYNKRGVNAYWICGWLPQSLHTDVKRKVVQGNDRWFLERKTMAASLTLKYWATGNLAWFRSAHSTWQQASFVHVSLCTPYLIPLLAVLSFQSSGFSSLVGEAAAPSLPSRKGLVQRGRAPPQAFPSTHPFWAQPGGL